MEAECPTTGRRIDPGRHARGLWSAASPGFRESGLAARGGAGGCPLGLSGAEAGAAAAVSPALRSSGSHGLLWKAELHDGRAAGPAAVEQRILDATGGNLREAGGRAGGPLRVGAPPGLGP